MNFDNHFFHIAGASAALGKHAPLSQGSATEKAYDPELLYVECQVCGKPVLWKAGHTTELLQAADVDVRTLDSTCMLLSDGCPLCKPDEWGGFSLSIVRLAGISVEDALHMLKPGGTA